MKKIIFTLLSVLAVSTSFGEVYKCKKNGSVSYQATPCLQKKNGNVIKLQISKLDKRPSSIKNCESKCEANDNFCRSKLSGGNYNSDGGLKVCKTKLDACIKYCVNPKEAARLAEIARKTEKDYKDDKASLRANKILEEKIAREKIAQQKQLRLQEKIHRENMALKKKMQEENEKRHEENMAIQSRILREQRKNRK